MDRPLRVLFLESQPGLLSDSQVHHLLMRSYDPRRVEVHVACNPRANGTKSASFATFESIPGLRIVPARFGARVAGNSRATVIASAPLAIASFAQMALYVKRHRVNVIHAASRPRDTLYAVMLARLTGARSVIHLHVMVSDWFSPLMRRALGACDAILAISDFVGRSVSAAGYPAEKSHVVLNSLDAADWNPALDGALIRRELGIPADAPLLAIVSRLFYWKGHTELLKALSLVRNQAPDVRLLIVGEDDQLAHTHGGSYRAELETLARNLGLSDNVIFTGFRTDVQRILAACDVYTMPSYEEPLGVAFLEAMAMKKPVVALNSGGVPEIVEHGKSGLLSTPGDIEALAANILTLIDDPGLRREMGAYGRAYVARKHNPRQAAAETEVVYRRITGDTCSQVQLSTSD